MTHLADQLHSQTKGTSAGALELRRLVVALWLGTLLAGCGGSGDPGDTAAGSGRPNARAMGLAGGKTTARVILPAIADPLLQNLSIPAAAPKRGMWTASVPWPLSAIHAAQLSDGGVLSYGMPFNNRGAQNGRFHEIWNLERRGDRSLRLTNLNSGRALDVAGGSLVDGGNVRQRDWVNAAKERWILRALATPPAPSLVNAGSPEAERLDSSFIARSELGDPACWSFESRNFPGFNLCQDGSSRVALSQRLANAAFIAEASFCARAPLSGAGGAVTLSLESLATPGRYLRHRSFELRLDPNVGSGVFPGDSSIRVQQALAP